MLVQDTMNRLKTMPENLKRNIKKSKSLILKKEDLAK